MSPHVKPKPGMQTQVKTCGYHAIFPSMMVRRRITIGNDEIYTKLVSQAKLNSPRQIETAPGCLNGNAVSVGRSLFLPVTVECHYNNLRIVLCCSVLTKVTTLGLHPYF